MLGSTALSGLAVMLVSIAVTSTVVLLWRTLDVQDALREDLDIISHVYPIVGLVYGVFLGFTIVITWTGFQDAEASVADEVTHLSELWRDSGPFPDSVRLGVRRDILGYVDEVLASDWASLAATGRHSSAATAAYEEIWDVYYQFQPETASQSGFYTASLHELNEFGRARRARSLEAQARVHPLVRMFLFGGGAMTVLFALLIPAKSRLIQAAVTSVMSGLIFFSIFLALSLQMPFSGDVSIRPTAFEEIHDSFERRLAEDVAAVGMQ